MRQPRGCVAGQAGQGAGEDGGGTALALTLILAVSSLLVAAVLYGAVVLATHRARTAADLAALAASARMIEGSAMEAACGQARQVAQANGGRIVACRAGPGTSGTVETEVHVALPRALRGLGPARATARAGPPT